MKYKIEFNVSDDGVVSSRVVTAKVTSENLWTEDELMYRIFSARDVHKEEFKKALNKLRIYRILNDKKKRA